MAEYNVHYPDFDVMRAENHWDPHTREIVEKRLDVKALGACRFFTPQEAETLFHLCSILLDDRREPIIAFVVQHFDSTLQASLGDSQRKVGVPQLSVLLRDGLALLDQVCGEMHGGKFAALEDRVQHQVADQLMQGKLTLQAGQKKFPIGDFKDRLLSEAGAAYYSYPVVGPDPTPQR